MKKILSLLATALFALGVTTASAASVIVFIYHPKAPKCLQK